MTHNNPPNLGFWRTESDPGLPQISGFAVRPLPSCVAGVEVDTFLLKLRNDSSGKAENVYRSNLELGRR